MRLSFGIYYAFRGFIYIYSIIRNMKGVIEMNKLEKEIERLKAELEAKHEEAKAKSYSWGRITTVGTVCFIIGMIVGNMLA